MIPELGTFCIGLALILSLVQAVIPLVGVAFRDRAYMAVGKSAAIGQFTFVVIAFVCLAYAFVTDDYSVSYVASHSNSLLPSMYKVAAVWGGHEGSILLWVLMLSGWQMAVALFSRSIPITTAARVLAVMAWIAIGFLLFILATSNPFERIFPPPMDGKDLNPLLQDPGLIIHPPTLYMGYVGLSVAFAFAIAALLGGKLDAAWARWTRPWTILAWLFLTAGITLGSWWSYYELGWGGWWFWDPVENASFMPWLVATALIHSLAATEKRGVLRSWTVLLAIIGFSLSLLGTFLVRSGVLTSVHAFATDPKRGFFILVFLGIVVGGSLLLYAIRAPKMQTTGQFEWFSREALILFNNIFLVVAMATVLLGTLFPLLGEAFGHKVSVGPPYFNFMFGLLMLPLLFLLAIGPLTRWKRHPIADMGKKLWPFLVCSVIAGAALPIILTKMAVVEVFLGLSLAIWIVASSIKDLNFRVDRRSGLLAGLIKLPRGYWGMLTAHMGIAVTTVGVVVVMAFGIERDVSLKINEKVTVNGYEFEFLGTESVSGPNYKAQRGHIKVYRDGALTSELWPQKRTYFVQQNPMTEADIDAGIWRDLYVALGEDLGQNAWSLRVQVKPFVRWIWGGAVIMLVGGLLAVTDKRYLTKKKPTAELATGVASI